jgi:HD-GYP domain-containing protein (c-di-GMP phosphodiesterase class II)
MSHFGDSSLVINHQLILVGEAFRNSLFLAAEGVELFGLSNLNVFYYSVEEFRQLDAISNEKILTLIVTDVNCVLLEQDFHTLNKFVIACNQASFSNVSISDNPTQKNLVSSIKMGFEFLINRLQLEILTEDIATVTQERKELGEIGVALTSEKSLDKLLTLVLSEGRKLGKCEAASLYLLLNPKSNNPELLFKLTQNSKIEFDFKEKKFPLTNKSLAGYVALTGEILNIADAYNLGKELPYHFDKSFDKKTGYRTREMLVLPMSNHKGKVIGVLQFINNKKHNEVYTGNVGFNQERTDLLFSLASQAAVSIDNSQLIENIQSLFEGFVAASVKAIESRDPVTSGHSFRVAEYTTGLAKSLDESSIGIYKNTSFSSEQMREMRYASLLHDFGKVGVKENVLLKANKLHESRYRFINLKIEWQKQLIEKQYYQALISGASPIQHCENSDLFIAMQNKIKQLNYYQNVLVQANKPSLLEAEVAEELKHLYDFNLDDTFPYVRKSLLSEKDFLSLSVTRGSLTNEERDEIQSHVVHTQEFLLAIPWTDELRDVPFIAGSHHEKLDGSGYPCGIMDKDIPIASKIMAVADIYDALTARDRPYKSAVKTELALDILCDEAKNGKLCSTMVNTFIETKIYRKINPD